MDYLQQRVRQFHKAFDIPIAKKPSELSVNAVTRRMNLIHEESEELFAALSVGDIVETADAIGDLLYVVYGTAVECGIDMYEINREIHRSNMTKVGGHKREDGKWVKPDNYSPANLAPIIEKQLKE